MTPAALAVAPPAQLTGTQKVAVVLMQMSPENAARVMAQFSETEAEDIAAEIVRLSRVDAKVAESVITEFHEIAVSGRRSPRGGRDLAAGLLEASFGSEKAAGVMDRLASTMAGKSFEFLDTVDPSQLLTLLDGELPETIALVLAHLRPDKASNVMASLGEGQAIEVAYALATMGSATPEAVSIIAESLKARTGATVTAGRKQVEFVGGVQPLVDIINRSDVNTERAVLEGLDERDPALAEEVRSKMLTFADIVKLERRDIQQILRGIDPTVLAKAMKGAGQAVTDAINANVSDRNREILESEITAVGPVRASEVNEARADIVRSIRELEASGAITVRRGDEDDIVY